MVGRWSSRLICLLILGALLALAVPPSFAQDTPGLSQTAQATDGGLTLSIAYPASWVEKTDGNRVLLASSQPALDELSSTGIVTSAGDTGIVVYLPSALASLGMDTTVSPAKIINAFLQMNKIAGKPASRSDFQVPAASVEIDVPSQAGLKGEVGVLQFPEGTVLYASVPAGVDAELVTAILNSLTFGGIQTEAAPGFGQTAQIKQGGLTLSVSYPNSWAAKDASDNLLLANSQTALDALSGGGAPDLKAGDLGMAIYAPWFTKNLQLAPNAPAADVVTAYLKAGQIEGTVEADDSFSVPAASALVTVPTLPGIKILIGALEFPDGTVLFALVPGDTDAEAASAILQSISLTGDAAQPETSVDLTLSDTPTILDVPQRTGTPLQFSLNLPEGWAYNYAQSSGLLYLGNSSSVVDKIASSNPSLAPGEIGITLVMPDELKKIGITATDTPENTIASFETAFKATGAVHTIDSLGVPAAYARVSGGNVPEGGGLAYALAFEPGMIFAVVQPASISTDSLAELFASIRFGEAAQPSPTPAPQAEALRQWAVYADGTSQYGKDSWSFEQATGAPNTPECGDHETAWADESGTGRAILRLGFAQPVILSQINVYQSFNPGAIVEIDVGNSSNPDKVLPLPHSADAPGNTPCPGVFSLDVSGVDVPVDFVVIYLDQSLTGDWDEIDAVELVGTPAS